MERHLIQNDLKAYALKLLMMNIATFLSSVRLSVTAMLI
jgi:hypothetical protein